MSQASLNQFLGKILSDVTLQDQLKNITNQNAFTQAIVRLGTDNGYQFDANDVDVVLMQNRRNPLGELSEAQLAQVAGGRPPATKDGCGSAWTTLFGACG